MKTVKTKLSVSTEIALTLLETMRANCCDLFSDSKFKKQFYALQNRVYEMFDTGIETDTVASYLVIEQIAPDGKLCKDSSTSSE